MNATMPQEPLTMEVSEQDIRNFQVTVRDHSRYDFTQYSLTSLRRRLTRILLEYDMTMDRLTAILRDDPEALERTVRKLTVHTTELFRDPVIWQKIRRELLPAWKDREEIHIWHPGCSTGQEVYSMMMVLEEAGLLDRTRIYATDINPDVLEVARRGRYKYHFNQVYLENFEKVLLNGEADAGIPQRKHWKRYFSVDETRDIIQMRESLCTKPVYLKLDLVTDHNLFGIPFDLIVCRNVIIYFNYELQNRVFDLFHTSLKEDGILLLGVHESIMGPYTLRFKKKDPFYLRTPA